MKWIVSVQLHVMACISGLKYVFKGFCLGRFSFEWDLDISKFNQTGIKNSL